MFEEVNTYSLPDKFRGMEDDEIKDEYKELAKRYNQLLKVYNTLARAVNGGY